MTKKSVCSDKNIPLICFHSESSKVHDVAFLQNLRSSLFGHKATPLHNWDSSAHVLINVKRKTCASLKTVSSYDSSQSDNDNHQSIKIYMDIFHL